jgi:hypothetical protein
MTNAQLQNNGFHPTIQSVGLMERPLVAAPWPFSLGAFCIACD